MKNIKLKDGGGGGGGATYIFTVRCYVVQSSIDQEAVSTLYLQCYRLSPGFRTLQVKSNGDQYPILIAGGGGGLGLGQFVDNGHQHGRGAAPPGRQPTSGTILSAEKGNKNSNNRTVL